MALHLDPGHVEYGYFYTDDFEKLCEYVLDLILIKEESIITILHASANFVKGNDIKELHMPRKVRHIWDPDQSIYHFNFIMNNDKYLVEDLENYENFESSDYTYIPGTITYFIKIFPCQPNPSLSPSRINSSDMSDDDSQENRPIKHNSFIIALGTYFYKKDSINKNKKLSHIKIRRNTQIINYINQWFPEFAGYVYSKFDLDFLARWHKSLNKYNIRVFSMRGNILYAKRRNNEESPWIDFYLNSQREFALIKSLNAIMKKRSDYHFCDNCWVWHATPNCTKSKITYLVEREDINLPEVPEGRHPLVCYADFECTTSEPHDVSGFSCVAIKKNGEIYMEHTENVLEVQGTSIIDDFIKFLFHIADTYSVFTGFGTEECTICGERIVPGQNFVNKRNFTNGLKGSSHKECWQHAKNTMVVFFHNFRGYDSHFVMREIISNYVVLNMQANNLEKFNLIRICRYNEPHITITFKDTFNFFSTSLANCVKNVEHWNYVEPEYRHAKALFPYDWFDNTDKLLETSLPPSPWTSKLLNQTIDATSAFEVWQKEGMEHFGDYHDFYCRLDTLQLAAIFEEFRNTAIKEFNYDPVHFQGAPALTWFLSLTKNIDDFKIIPDCEVYMDIQSNIRGGVSQAMVRYYEKQPGKSVIFLDVNSLYSKCMTYKLPTNYIRKLNKLPVNWRRIYNENSDITALICVDLEYPQHLHDRDWAYPLAPHKYNERLCTTFLPRYNYLVHAELLQFYEDRGMVISKVHYLYEFGQDYILRGYVDHNIIKRRATSSEVMKTLYKLLNNSLYGKTCENVFKYRKFEQVSQEQYEDGRINPKLLECKDCIAMDDEDLSFLCEMPVTIVKLNKPIQMGFTILEFAKREMYRFIATLQDEFGDDVVPMYTDTDSLMLLCNFERPYQRFFDNEAIKPFLDFDKVPEEWGIRTPGTDKQSGLWSVEANGKEIVQYVGIRAKCYAYQFEDGATILKNKGIPRTSLKDNDEEITLEDYKKAIFESDTTDIKYYKIQSKRHVVSTYQVQKLGISANDLKRTIPVRADISLPFGYRGQVSYISIFLILNNYILYT